jgi:hypothetical protein
MEDQEKQEIWDAFNEAVNMSPGELEEWLSTPESQEVGLTREGEDEAVGHQSGSRIVAIMRAKQAV